MVRISDSWIQKKDMSKDVANWDARADTFNGPILNKENPLISLIYKLAGPSSDKTRVIDIGCGTGRVSMAFAKDVKEVVGLDLSPVMTGMANDKAKANGIDNAKFSAADWSTMDVSGLGMFDITLAHMTPAICSKETFEKMLSVSRGWVFVSSHISSGNKNWNELSEMVGQPRPVESNKMLYILDILWERGIYPEICYQEADHNRDMPAEVALESFKSSAKSKGLLNEEMSTKIEEMVKNSTIDGKFVMDSNPASAMLYWKMPERS